MLKRIIFTIIATLSLLSLSARELTVESFRLLPNDNTAQITPVKDLNGDDCALVKVKTDVTGCVFDGAIGEVRYQDGAYYVHLSPGTRRITLNCPNYERFTLEFNTVSDIVGVKSRCTYSVVLSDKEDYSKPIDVMDKSYLRALSVREFSPILSDITARTKERREIINESFEHSTHC